MISALLGSIIMSAATLAMLVALSITNKALKEAGKYPLTDDEKTLLRKQGFSEKIIEINERLKDIEIFN